MKGFGGSKQDRQSQTSLKKPTKDDVSINSTKPSKAKNQSNVQYHAEFEATKSKFTAVTDDPELIRLKSIQNIKSNISYHGLVEQKEDQEKKRSVMTDEAPSVPVVGM